MRRTGARAKFLPKALALAVLFLTAASVTPSFSQSLGELAQREKAKRDREREKKAGAAKVFTEDDLQKGEKPRTETSAASTEPAPPSATAAPETPRRESSDEPSGNTDRGASGADGGREFGGVSESAWKARAAAARDSLKNVELQASAADAEVERLRQDLNPMSTTFSTDPYVTLRLQGQLTDAQAKAAAARDALKVAKEVYAAFQDEARRAGVPSGWLSE